MGANGHGTDAPRLAGLVRESLAPDGESRLSPSLQELQLQLLFRDEVAAGCDLEALTRRHQERVAALAYCYDEFWRDGLPFDQDHYGDDRFLDAYLAHYTPRYVLSIQHVMCDLLAAELLPADAKVVDVGVGPGTTLLAVADFYRVTAEHAASAGLPCPASNVRYRGIDIQAEVLVYARRTADTYRQRLGDLLAAAPASERAGLRLATSTAAGARWHQDDALTCALHLDDEPVLAVFGNVLTEIARRDGWEERLLSQFSELPAGSLVLIVEPAEHDKSDRLAGLRKQLLASSIAQPLLPCCQDLAPSESGRCHGCWGIRDIEMAASPLDVAMGAYSRGGRKARHGWVYSVLGISASPLTASQPLTEVRPLEGKVVPDSLVAGLLIVGRVQSTTKVVCCNRFGEVQELLVTGGGIEQFGHGDRVDLHDFMLARGWRPGQFKLVATDDSSVTLAESRSAC